MVSTGSAVRLLYVGHRDVFVDTPPAWDYPSRAGDQDGSEFMTNEAAIV